MRRPMNFDIHAVPTPCYVVDETLLRRNLEILQSVSKRTGCKILLAQKAFSMFSFYPLVGEYLDGTTASGLFEAKLGKEEMGKETHVFSAAYRDDEFDEIVSICDHIVFNSMTQWEKFGKKAQNAGKECGLRINPECSTQDHAIYDPCSPGSRLGIPAAQMPEELPEGIRGLHFHTLCEQNADALVTTLEAVQKRFETYLHRIDWLNFGGGHHITRPDYDVEALVRCIDTVQQKYGVQVYLEPGEAVALNTGFLVSTVLDVIQNGIRIAILDTSAACHMPDVLEMPYRPEIIGAGMPGEKPYTYCLAGPTCLAGDRIGEYSFDAPLQAGDRLAFCDMAHYSMVKNNTFNGINLPSILKCGTGGSLVSVRTFGYDDFKNRLS